MTPQKPATPMSVVSPHAPPAKTTPATLHSLLASVNIKTRFEEMLGKEASGFISSILSLANSNKLLSTADPISIISAAAIAASLKLPINPSLGFAYIVPYRDGKSGKTFAQFQIGWKGLVQLAIRTGEYKTMNAVEIYDGELVSYNRLTGEMKIDDSKRASEKVIGYYAFFQLMRGFEKAIYMDVDQIRDHAERYSKSFKNASGPWKTNFDAMALKTVMKLLLSKWAMLSVDMQTAIRKDQVVIDENEKVAYQDNTGDEVIEASVLTEPDVPEAKAEEDPDKPRSIDPDELIHEQ